MGEVTQSWRWKAVGLVEGLIDDDDPVDWSGDGFGRPRRYKKTAKSNASGRSHFIEMLEGR